MYERRVRVLYPAKRGLIVLSVGRGAGKQLEPESVSADGQTFEFSLSSERPFVYCKPCLIDGAGRHRACGPDNLVVLTEPGSRDIYPYFQEALVGVISPRLELQSKILGRAHRLRIYLPPGYGENTLKRYPVIYMQDGKNLFFPDEAFQGTEWEVDETLDLLDSMNVIDKTIVVGVYAEKREEEYTSPGYRLYGRSLVEEVKPLVDSSFRTLTGPAETGVMGSSLGGVVSFFLAWEWPEVFGRAACLSSTFTWRDDLIERVLEEPKREVKIYLDSGWPGDNYEVTLSMAMALLERGYTFGSDFLYFVFPRAPHGEASWAERFHLPLQLFSGKVVKAARRMRMSEVERRLTV
ncbi:MAG TPA: alpha/beta hydrolase-fold protein [Pyrinomonadaceae bacterium]|nr:alpha/beta hydrolase-fold protein [Pyrinomonadaceae bacterium]